MYVLPYWLTIIPTYSYLYGVPHLPKTAWSGKGVVRGQALVSMSDRWFFGSCLVLWHGTIMNVETARSLPAALNGFINEPYC